LCSDYCALSAHVLIAEQTTSEARQIVDQVAQMLEERFRIVHTTLQAESEACADACVPDGNGAALCAHEPGH
jgi:Co/Zn/Cd efflux system component